MHATKFVTTPTARGRVTHLEVDFTDRDGQTHLVTGPVTSPGFAVSARPRKNGLHVAAVSKGVAVCKVAGTEFWGLAESPRTYWAVSGGQFFQVRYVPQRSIVTVQPVSAWGQPTGDVTEHPATEAIR